MPLTEAGSSHTNWALIFDAAKGEGLPAKTALEQLVRRYWPAVYAYIRQSGRDIHESADLTQGFVCEVILGRNLFEHADPARGRFRTLLLTALQNYIREKHRHDHRAKRAPENLPLRLDHHQLESLQPTSDLTPEQAFSAQWHATMVHRVLERVKAGCIAAGLESHWRVFEARVVKPMLQGERPMSYSKLVELLELDDAGQAANMIVTVKRRFVRALVEEIGLTVNDPMQIEDEMRALLREVESNL